MRDYIIELDRRFADHERHHTSERNADQEALRIARESLAKALAQTNEFRAEATEDKAKYAENTVMFSELAKLKQELETEYERENQVLVTRINSVASASSETSSEVSKIGKTSASREGRELGWRGALLAAIAAVVSAIVSVLARIFFG